jgi:PAS domain-containing protein
VRDVSDRKRVEAALRESEMRFRATFEDAPTGIALTDLSLAGEGRWLEVNAAVVAMLGYHGTRWSADRSPRWCTPTTLPLWTRPGGQRGTPAQDTVVRFRSRRRPVSARAHHRVGDRA